MFNIIYYKGAPVPSDWTPPAGLERHVPVLFLDLNPDDLSVPNQSTLNGSFESSTFFDGLNITDDGQFLTAAGNNSILPKEHGGQFSTLSIIRYLDNDDIGAIAAWDSSIHDSQYLNRVTEANERVYLILKATVIYILVFDEKTVLIYCSMLFLGSIVSSFPYGSHFTKTTSY